jgi:hypothetical protein
LRTQLRSGPRWVYCLFVLIVLQGCAEEKPNVTAVLGPSLSDYQVLQVLPASNQTGQTFSFDIGSFFTNELKSDLMTKGRVVSAPGQVEPNTLIIKCSITS